MAFNEHRVSDLVLTLVNDQRFYRDCLEVVRLDRNVQLHSWPLLVGKMAIRNELAFQPNEPYSIADLLETSRRVCDHFNELLSQIQNESTIAT